MSRTLNLSVNGNVTLDDNGSGTITLGPNITGVIWTVTLVACATTSTVNTPVFNLYQSINPDPTMFLGGTYSGNNDEYTPILVTLYSGQGMTGQWVNGDAGATATMTLTGTQQVP
jgi:hypothetical protein